MEKREFLRWKVPKKVKEFGPNTTKLTYKQVGDMSYKFGAALREIGGCVPSPLTTTLDKVTTPGCRMAIFENTCTEWLISALGATTQSVTVVTVYATLGLDAVIEAINDNLCKVIVCNKCNVMNLFEKCDKMPTLTTIVYTNDMVSKECDYALPKPSKTDNDLNILSFDEFIALGDTSKYPPTPPTPTTTSTVM